MNLSIQLTKTDVWSEPKYYLVLHLLYNTWENF